MWLSLAALAAEPVRIEATEPVPPLVVAGARVRLYATVGTGAARVTTAVGGCVPVVAVDLEAVDVAEAELPPGATVRFGVCSDDPAQVLLPPLPGLNSALLRGLAAGEPVEVVVTPPSTTSTALVGLTMGPAGQLAVPIGAAEAYVHAWDVPATATLPAAHGTTTVGRADDLGRFVSPGDRVDLLGGAPGVPAGEVPAIPVVALPAPRGVPPSVALAIPTEAAEPWIHATHTARTLLALRGGGAGDGASARIAPGLRGVVLRVGDTAPGDRVKVLGDRNSVLVESSEVLAVDGGRALVQVTPAEARALAAAPWARAYRVAPGEPAGSGG